MKYILESGVKCFFIENKSPISTVSIWINSGYSNDPKEKEGLSHLLEHVISSNDNVTQKLDLLGIQYYAYTYRENTVFYNSQRKEQTEDSLIRLIDNCFSINFSNQIIEKEKKVVLQEEIENRQNIDSYFWRLRDSVLFASEKLNTDVYGNKNTLGFINRDDLINFYEEQYIPQNITVVVVGDVDQQKILSVLNKKIESRYSNLINVNSNSINYYEDNKKQSIFEKRNDSIMNVGVYYKIKEKIPLDKIVMFEFLREYIAGSWISFLNKKLRQENQITYWVKSSGVNYISSGFLGFEFACSEDIVKKVIKDSVNDIEDINFLEKNNIELFKNTFILSTLKNTEESEKKMFWYSYFINLFDIELSPEDYIKKVEDIKIDDLVDFSKKIFLKENRFVTVMGPNLIDIENI